MSSFTMMIKEEISQKTFKKCCQQALLSAFIRYNMTTKYLNNFSIIEISSFQNPVIKLIYQLIKAEFPNINLKLIVNRDSKKNRYNIIITSHVSEVITKLYLKNQDSWYLTQKNINKDCIRAYITGIFLVSGSINSPQTPNYHLELQFKYHHSAKILQIAVLKYFQLKFKIITRRNKFVLYLKKSNEISDFLKVIDCPEAVFIFEDKRITRELLNTINRFNNIDISNQQKSLSTGLKQVKMIEYLIKEDVFHELSEKCQILARIRLLNQDSSLADLSQFYYQKSGETITKSGVNHLMIEIKKKYQELLKN